MTTIDAKVRKYAKLDSRDILLILRIISERFGLGDVEIQEVRNLQAKLSWLLAIAHDRER